MRYSFVLCLAGILFLALLTAGCTSQSQSGGAPTNATTIPTQAAVSVCGFTSCHGLDLACGSNPPQVCTAMYQLGDKCRQYAYCSNTGGSCMLVTTTEYEKCKSCIEHCGGADTNEIFLCEETC
ncbi:MAG: hypothetical protein ABFC24_07760 [Methanoregulaceae archaeon]